MSNSGEDQLNPEQRNLIYIALSKGLSLEDAEDVAQEAWYAYLKYLQKKETTEIRSHRALLLKIFHNKYVDICKKNRRQTDFINRLTEFATAKSHCNPKDLALQEQLHLIREALDKLPVDLRKVTRMRYFEKLSVEEIADRLRTTKSVVYHKLRTAFKKLRRILRKDFEE